MTEEIVILEINKKDSLIVGALGFEPRSTGLFLVHSSSHSS